MHKNPKLIFINGPVGVGKSTIAQMYIDNHTLALLLSADDLVGSMGKWLENEDKARELSLEYILLIAERHLKAGYDVVLPYLLAHPKEMKQVEEVVTSSDAVLFEFALIVPRGEAVERAIERGTWGEPGSPPLTEDDRGTVEDLYDKFEKALDDRPKSVRISVKKNDIAGTYQDLMDHLK